jgi:two-component system, NtrC family, response regulator
MTPGRILIIDENEKHRSQIGKILAQEGYKVLECSNAKSSFKIIEKEELHLVIVHVELPDMNGIDLITKIKCLNHDCEVIMITSKGTIHDGVKAIKCGAFDYITQGEGEEQIIPTVNRAFEKVLLGSRVRQLEKSVERKYDFDFIIGNSNKIKKSVELAKRVAATDTTVLLLGETGTGKEVFAQAIHNGSSRKQKSFVAINCSAIAKDLLESEMFGYKAGAFTGATKDKKGLFEEANWGTIFLDEIGEMNMDLQAKLLRVLETQTFIKAGDTKETYVNVRIIAATNRDLLKEAEKDHFRMDLYYRLSTFTISLPPLRERKEDIETLALEFLKPCSDKVNKKIKQIDKDFLERLKDYPFKGNIRELRNVIERAIILSDSEILTGDLLPPEFFNTTSESTKLDLASIEKSHIEKVLKLTKGNKTKAAEILQIGIATLYRKIEEYELV